MEKEITNPIAELDFIEPDKGTKSALYLQDLIYKLTIQQIVEEKLKDKDNAIQG